MENVTLTLDNHNVLCHSNWAMVNTNAKHFRIDFEIYQTSNFGDQQGKSHGSNVENIAIKNGLPFLLVHVTKESGVHCLCC